MEPQMLHVGYVVSPHGVHTQTIDRKVQLYKFKRGVSVQPNLPHAWSGQSLDPWHPLVKYHINFERDN